MENQWQKLLKALKEKKKEETDKKDGKRKITWEDIGLPRLIILFLAGVFLLVLSLPSGTFSSSDKKEKKQKETDSYQAENSQDAAWAAMSEYAARQEKEIETILSQVEGVGKVDVMLTMASSEEKVTLQNETLSDDSTQETDSNGGNRNHTSNSIQRDSVLVEGEDGEVPYVVQVQSPKIEGVVVVAQGAGKGSINTEIIEAVEALFPIEPHKIKVMRME